MWFVVDRFDLWSLEYHDIYTSCHATNNNQHTSHHTEWLLDACWSVFSVLEQAILANIYGEFLHVFSKPISIVVPNPICQSVSKHATSLLSSNNFVYLLLALSILWWDGEKDSFTPHELILVGFFLEIYFSQIE